MERCPCWSTRVAPRSGNCSACGRPACRARGASPRASLCRTSRHTAAHPQSCRPYANTSASVFLSILAPPSTRLRSVILSPGGIATYYRSFLFALLRVTTLLSVLYHTTTAPWLAPRILAPPLSSCTGMNPRDNSSSVCKLRYLGISSCPVLLRNVTIVRCFSWFL